jgi:hypothetical protein
VLHTTLHKDLQVLKSLVALYLGSWDLHPSQHHTATNIYTHVNVQASKNWTCVLSNSMEQNPSWEATSHSNSQEISRLLWNPEFITVFTRARQWSLSCTRRIQFTPYQNIYSNTHIILSSTPISSE